MCWAPRSIAVKESCTACVSSRYGLTSFTVSVSKLNELTLTQPTPPSAVDASVAALLLQKLLEAFSTLLLSDNATATRNLVSALQARESRGNSSSDHMHDVQELGAIQQTLTVLLNETEGDLYVSVCETASRHGSVGTGKLLVEYMDGIGEDTNQSVPTPRSLECVDVGSSSLSESDVQDGRYNDSTSNCHVAVDATSDDKIMHRHFFNSALNVSNVPNDSNASFILACQDGNVATVKQLLEDSHIDPTSDNNAAIKIACSGGRWIGNGAEYLTSKDMDNGGRFVEIVKMLLQDRRIDPAAQDSKALRLATEIHQHEIVKLLLQDIRSDPSATQNQALVDACTTGDIVLVDIFLDDGRANPAANDNEAIIEASIYGCADVTQRLLKDSRVNPAAQNNAALIGAATEGHTDIVKILISDQRVRACARDNAAIKSACRYGNHQVVKVLLNDPRIDPCNVADTQLDDAFERGFVDVVSVLLPHANLQARELSRQLNAAVSARNSEIFAMLLQHQNVNQASEDEIRASEYIRASSYFHIDTLCDVDKWRFITDACRSGCAQIVKLLLPVTPKTGKSINDPAYCASIAALLAIASEAGHFEVVRVLLKDGAFAGAEMQFHLYSCLQMAFQGGHINIVRFLLTNRRTAEWFNNCGALEDLLFSDLYVAPRIEVVREILKCTGGRFSTVGHFVRAGLKGRTEVQRLILLTSAREQDGWRVLAECSRPDGMCARKVLRDTGGGSVVAMLLSLKKRKEKKLLVNVLLRHVVQGGYLEFFQ